MSLITAKLPLLDISCNEWFLMPSVSVKSVITLASSKLDWKVEILLSWIGKQRLPDVNSCFLLNSSQDQ